VPCAVFRLKVGEQQTPSSGGRDPAEDYRLSPTLP
jgi:hypothetical protein